MNDWNEVNQQIYIGLSIQLVLWVCTYYEEGNIDITDYGYITQLTSFKWLFWEKNRENYER